MKHLFLLLALLLPVCVNGMKIVTDEVDEFTGQRTVITSWENIEKKTTAPLSIRFRQQNNHQFLEMKMFYNGAIVIAQDNKLMFKSDKGEIASLESIATYSGSKGGGATGFMGSDAWGISATYTGDLEYFANNVTVLMRIYTTDGYIDKKITEANGAKLKDLYNLFKSAINKK